MSFPSDFTDNAEPQMAITHTEYHIEIVSKKTTRAAARKHSRQFNQRIDYSIHAAILKAARATLHEHIKTGKLSKVFTARMIS
jgi:hypothetical protein